MSLRRSRRLFGLRLSGFRVTWYREGERLPARDIRWLVRFRLKRQGPIRWVTDVGQVTAPMTEYSRADVVAMMAPQLRRLLHWFTEWPPPFDSTDSTLHSLLVDRGWRTENGKHGLGLRKGAKEEGDEITRRIPAAEAMCTRSTSMDRTRTYWIYGSAVWRSTWRWTLLVLTGTLRAATDRGRTGKRRCACTSTDSSRRGSSLL